MDSNILVGTASWTDKTLIACGRFYPGTCRTAEQRLRFYTQQFPLVEVDSSYYAVPTPQVAQLWAERTPAHFVFHLGTLAEHVHVIFNTNNEDQGQVGARMMRELLRRGD